MADGSDMLKMQEEAKRRVMQILQIQNQVQLRYPRQ